MEFLNSVLSILVEYQAGVNRGLFYGVIAAMIAASLSVIVYVFRWMRLLAHRKRDSRTIIKAGGLEGEASALYQLTKELREYEDAGRTDEATPDREDGKSGSRPEGEDQNPQSPV